MTIWFTSDPHFGHNNIIEYCKRPFDSIDIMNEAIVSNWNAAVMPTDEVYLLGDVAFMKPAAQVQLLSRLNGRVFLIQGNHDVKRLNGASRARFEWVKDLHELKVRDGAETQRIVLCHFPLLTWNKSHRGAWHLHGHCHGTLPDSPNALRIDVGVDCHGFSPVSYASVKELMSRKTFKPVDHHGAD